MSEYGSTASVESSARHLLRVLLTVLEKFIGLHHLLIPLIENREPVINFRCHGGIELELELIQPHMAQKPVAG